LNATAVTTYLKQVAILNFI